MTSTPTPTHDQPEGVAAPADPAPTDSPMRDDALTEPASTDGPTAEADETIGGGEAAGAVKRAGRRAMWALLGLTLLAGLLRFAFLDRPGLWHDEGATFYRINGTWEQMFEVLKDDGFPPLHYELFSTFFCTALFPKSRI